jgi:hypothetical protein
MGKCRYSATILYYRLDGRGAGVQFLLGARQFTPQHIVWIVSHQSAIEWVLRAFSLWVKLPWHETAGHSSASGVNVKNAHGVIAELPYASSWHGAYLSIETTFTFLNGSENGVLHLGILIFWALSTVQKYSERTYFGNWMFPSAGEVGRHLLSWVHWKVWLKLDFLMYPTVRHLLNYSRKDGNIQSPKCCFFQTIERWTMSKKSVNQNVTFTLPTANF